MKDEIQSGNCYVTHGHFISHTFGFLSNQTLENLSLFLFGNRMGC